MSNKYIHNDTLALYVHWPYCLAKCPYCDFNSHVSASVDHERWRKAYKADLSAQAAKLGTRRLTSIFFGGGTPSLMEAESVATVIETARELWEFDDNIEITLEANPTSIEAEKFRDFASAGVNRVSVGVQALNDADLKALGREHSVQEALNALEIAATTFERFSFDLIYTREGQSLEQWVAELNRAIPLAKAGHMSLYQLTIEAGTKFKTLFDSGRLILPDDDVSAEFYNTTIEMMDKNGMPMYEISNYAATGQQSRHNLTYWHYGDYIGVGPGAHGRCRVLDHKEQMQTIATRAHKAPDIWLDHVLRDAHHDAPFQRAQSLNAQDQMEEMLLVGLRLRSGVYLPDIQERTGLNPLEFINSQNLAMLQDEGLIHFDASQLSLTRKSYTVLDSVIAALLS